MSRAIGSKISRAVVRDKPSAIQKAPNSVPATMAANRASRVQTSVVSDSTAMLPMISWLSEIGRTTRSRLPSNRATASVLGCLASFVRAGLDEIPGRM